MSADNWAVCPRCRERAKVEREKAIDAVAQMYGKVTPGEYDAARAAIPDGNVSRENFREDYEIYGAEDGVVRVGYSGSCRDCGFAFSFDTEYPIPGLDS